MPEKKSSEQNKETKKETANEADDPVTKAHRLAVEDIEADPDLNTQPEPGDDLDEGELARFEGED
jgi:hypothetical protein